MKHSRRTFINSSIALSAGVVLHACSSPTGKEVSVVTQENIPVVISTWDNKKANAAAWKIISESGSALDAVEAGARIPESDENDQSVGYGGRPDRDGEVTLDACIMDEYGNCGAVTCLKGIKHPISVARKVIYE